MCLLGYRRMPDDEYRLRYNDPDGQILPLLWLGGSVLCLWFAAGATLVVSVLAGDLLLGLAVGLGGAILGIAAASFLAVVFPQLDARYLRLGPLAAIIEFVTLFIGAAVVILLGLWALGVFPADAVTPTPAVADTSLAADQAPEGEETDLFDLLRRVSGLFLLLGLVVIVVQFLAARIR